MTSGSSVNGSKGVIPYSSPLKKAKARDLHVDELGEASNKNTGNPAERLLRGSVDASITEARTKLPIWIAKDAIADSVAQNDTVVVLGETGSGKTTRK